MRHSEASQQAPHGDAMDVNSMRLSQFGHQFVERDFALGSDAGLNPASQPRQFAVTTTIALAARCQRTGLAPQFDEFVDEFRRHSKVPRRLAVSVTLVDVIKHAFP